LKENRGRQTEQLLQEIDPTIQKSKRKVRHLNQDQVEVKIVLSKKAYESMNQLKHLLSHRNLSEGEIFALLINLGLEKYDPRKYKTREDKKTQSKKAQLRIRISSQKNRNKKTPDTSKTKFQYVFEKTEIKERGKNHEEIGSRNSQNNHEELTARNLQNNHEKYITRNSQNSNQVKQKTNSIKKISRYIPARTRKQVWLRDEGKCTYTCSQTKKRCHSRHFLQIDHIQPYALGGNHNLKNLRLLCANHNQHRN